MMVKVFVSLLFISWKISSFQSVNIVSNNFGVWSSGPIHMILAVRQS